MAKNVKIPANYQTVMPYLIVRNATAFKEFAKQVFDAKEMFQHMRDELTIQHGELMIGECTIMYANATEKYPPRPAGMFVYEKG
ncbi:MAG: hypothetical protein ACHQET_09565 [Chitinophagales bacterium]